MNDHDWADEDMGDIDELDFNDDEEVNWSECPGCGYENEEDDIFCAMCGARLREDDTEETD